MQITILVWNCSVVKGAAKAVLACLASHADHNGCNAFPSQATLMAKTGYSRRTVQRALRLLEDLGIIRRTGGRKSRRGRAVIVWRIFVAALKGVTMAHRPAKQLQKQKARQEKKRCEADAWAILAAQYGWDTLQKWSDQAISSAIGRIIAASPR